MSISRLWGHWSPKMRRASIRARGLRTMTFLTSRLVCYVVPEIHWAAQAEHVAKRHKCSPVDLELWVLSPEECGRLLTAGSLLAGETLGQLKVDVPLEYLLGPYPYQPTWEALAAAALADPRYRKEA